MRRWVIGLAIVLFAMSALWLYIRRQSQTVEQHMTPVLKENEREKVTIDLKAGRITDVARHLGRRRSTSRDEAGGSYNNARKAAITVTNTGQVQIWAQTQGFIFEPGVAAGTVGDRGVVGIDAQVWFRNRWGLNIGVLTDRGWHVNEYVACSYNVFRNTSLFIGVNNHRDFVFGARVGF